MKVTSLLSGMPLLACAALVPLLFADRAAAQDIYIGTLEYREHRLVLRRCDLVQTTYLVHDAADSVDRAISKFAKNAKTRQGVWYAEVIGRYHEKGNEHALEVIELHNVEAGKSCHLLDLLPPAKEQGSR